MYYNHVPKLQRGRSPSYPGRKSSNQLPNRLPSAATDGSVHGAVEVMPSGIVAPKAVMAGAVAGTPSRYI